MKKIIHIAPSLPPTINGLGDFCKILACNLANEKCFDNIFLVRHHSGIDQEQNVQVFTPYNLDKILLRQKADAVILHYVGYAYDKRGLPFYVSRSLKKYKQLTNCRVLVFFHELYSSSRSLFKLPFYTNGLQKVIVKQLCNIADAGFTNCSLYNDLLQKLVGKNRFNSVCTGIFSNVPEELYNSGICKERKTMMVFGSYHRRQEVYRNEVFTKILEILAIESVYDIGPGECDFSRAHVKVLKKGPLSTSDLAVHLNKAEFGALSYEPHLLGKSGIFSAYAAFGVIPINVLEIYTPLSDGLVEGKNYLTWKSDSNSERFNDETKEELLKWYNTHNQKAVTEKVKMHL